MYHNIDRFLRACSSLASVLRAKPFYVVEKAVVVVVVVGNVVVVVVGNVVQNELNESPVSDVSTVRPSEGFQDVETAAAAAAAATWRKQAGSTVTRRIHFSIFHLTLSNVKNQPLSLFLVCFDRNDF